MSDFDLNLSTNNGTANNVDRCSEAFPYVQTLINENVISDLIDYNPNDIISYQEFARQLVNTHLKLIQNNLDKFNRIFSYTVKIIKTTSPEHESAIEALRTTLALVERVSNDRSRIYAEALMVNATASAEDIRNNVFLIDGTSPLQREDAAVILSNTSWLLDLINNNLKNSSPLSQWNVIGNKLSVNDEFDGDEPEIGLSTTTINDDETFDINLPLEDQNGFPLIYYYAVKGGTLEPINNSSFNRVRFTPPQLSQSTTFTMYVWIANSEGDFSERYIDINVNPSDLSIITEPSIQASNLRFSDITMNSLRVRWDRGSGERIMLTCTPCGNTVIEPNNGESYIANSNINSGDVIGGSTVAVYNSTESTTTVSGLNVNSCYTFKIYEYNGTGNQTRYSINNALRANASTAELLELDFIWEPEIIVAGEEIDFDWISSEGGLTTENWTFEEATPETDNTNGSNIVFNSPGLREVTLTGFLGTSNQTITISKNVNVYSSTDAAPDFIFESGLATPNTILSGFTVEVEWSIVNQGLTRGRVNYVDAFLTTDMTKNNIIHSWDRSSSDFIGDVAFFGGESLGRQVELEFPDALNPGTYYLLLEIQSSSSLNASSEVNFDNNLIAIPIVIEATLPDLTLENITLNKTTFASGDEIEINFDVINLRNINIPNNPSIDLTAFLSTDDVLDEEDGAFFSNLTIANISSGITASSLSPPLTAVNRTLNGSISPLLASGQYYLFVTIDAQVTSQNSDNIVAEFNEGNNIFKIPITISNPNQPTIPASDVQLVDKTDNTCTISINSGNGQGRILLVSSSANRKQFPLDGHEYSYNSDWILAPNLFTSENNIIEEYKIMFVGDSEEVVLTGFEPDETYYFQAYEYNGSGALIDYFQQRDLPLAVHFDSDPNIKYSDGSTTEMEVNNFTDMKQLDNNFIAIGGNHGQLLKSEDELKSWSIIPVDFNVDLRHIIKLKEGPYLMSSFSDSKLYRSTDLGDSWDEIVLPQNEGIRRIMNIYSIDEGLSFVIAHEQGSESFWLYRSTDGGESWSLFKNNEFESLVYSLAPVGDRLMMCGNNGLIVESIDRGITWQRVNTSIGTSELLANIQFVNNDIGFLNSVDKIFKTTNGGMNWSLLVDNVSIPILSKSLLFIDANNGFHLNGSSVMKTTNGGETWTSTSYNIGERAICDLNNQVGILGNHDIVTLDVCTAYTYFKDLDGDGYGNDNFSLLSCESDLLGYSILNGDCDDTNSLVYPGAEELCDNCLLYTSPSPRDATLSRMPSSA